MRHRERRLFMNFVANVVGNLKRHKHLLRPASGFRIAVMLSLAYLFFGAWDLFGWSPEPLWAQILFFPGLAVGHLCWDHFSHSEIVCQAVGVVVMGIVGGIIGLALHVVIRKQQTRENSSGTGRA
jgi:hypothetical protein